MKILSGSLKETLYKWPSDCEHGPMTPAQSTLYRQEDVTYINGTLSLSLSYVCVTNVSLVHSKPDAIGLHRVENPSHTDTAVSLHLYSPPICHCKCFDQRSGRAESCRVTFHTKCDNSSSCTNWISVYVYSLCICMSIMNCSAIKKLIYHIYYVCVCIIASSCCY